MLKKALSLVVSIMLMVTSLSFAIVSASAADVTYVVAGTSNLCGVEWTGSPADAPANVMTDNGDGTYSKVFTDVQPAEGVQFKIVENTADGSQNWIGDETGNNVTFNVTAACDVAVNFDSATKKITVTGDGVQFVTDLEITSINAVGNGDPEDEGNWLNGVAWDPSANAMTEVSDKVYEITFDNVTAYDNYQVKFAANGAWTDSWGCEEENFTAESGVAFDAAYNGKNIVVNVPYEKASVTLKLDLTNFDYASKTGAVATVTVTDAAEPAATYVVAGTSNLCGVEWTGSPADAPANVMTANGDGTYTKVFTDVQPAEGVQLKVVENVEGSDPNWIGDETGNNVTFNVTSACDVTVTFDSATKKITVTGDGVQFVTDLEITSINAVGNGDPDDEGNWLNNVAWDPSANAMTEVSDKVYEITFDNVTAYDNYQVKFAANGAWTDSWGCEEENFTAESGVAFDAVYNGKNIVVNVPYEKASVTLKLDLTNFDYASKTGAVATVTVTDAAEPAATYVVAGSEALCGVNWIGSPADAPANVMTANGDGTFTKVFTDVQPAEALQLKVVENAADGTQTWIGDETDNNVTFDVETACDVTVTFDSATKKITVTGDGVKFVTELVIDSINAVGNGDPEDEGGWLNGVAWDPSANAMTEVSDKVYEITFDNVTAYDNYQVKFAANGAWTDSWGYEEENFTAESGVAFDAAYNGQNIVVNVPYEKASVTLKLDLTNFDYSTKTGAVATVTVTEPATVKTLTVNATSNLFPASNVVVPEEEEFVTVTYYFQSEKELLDADFVLEYDTEYLEMESILTPYTEGVTINSEEPGKVFGVMSNLDLYYFDQKTPFVSAVFKKRNVGETEVNLYVDNLTLSVSKAEGGSDETQEEGLVRDGQLSDTTTQYSVDTEVLLGSVTPIIPSVPTKPTESEPQPTESEPQPTESEPQPTESEPQPTESEPQPTESEPQPTESEPQPTDATSATGASVNGGSTADTPNGGNNSSSNTSNNGTVKTGSASMAIMILLVLVSATGVVYFTRKKIK